MIFLLFWGMLISLFFGNGQITVVLGILLVVCIVVGLADRNTNPNCD
jgi:hypothetical protein